MLVASVANARKPTIFSAALSSARESHVQSGHLWTIDLRSEACRWNLRRTANPVRHETHILKAFDIEGSQAGGLSSFTKEFCRPRRSCNGEDSITGPA